MAKEVDGPYVFYKKYNLIVNYIVDSNGTKHIQRDTVNLKEKRNLSLHVGDGTPDQSFSVKLKDQLINEKSEFKKVDKMLVVSDIEGDFRSFIKLLRAGNVIDENFNWTFGNGNLVLVGDFLDRGRQVTEVLWLIYALEDKAKAAGGYVHYILGNHEIMDLSGDTRYVNPKYFDNARLMQKSYDNLYDDNSELGRWLKTKNVVEKIGALLFVHGGISKEVNNLGISITKINQFVRPYYSKSREQYFDPAVSTILNQKVGPFWYRGYYDETQKAKPEQINKTLSKYKLTGIITGHTVYADTISVCYDGKIINLDTHDNHGIAEALLIEEGKYYRINPFGEKFLIME